MSVAKLITFVFFIKNDFIIVSKITWIFNKENDMKPKHRINILQS